MRRYVHRAGTAFLAAILTFAAAPVLPQQGQVPSLEQQRIGEQEPLYPHPRLNKAIKRQRSRLEFVGLEPLVDSLEIKDGMTILDIGAGPGYVSFLFAKRLNGSGEVFATDIREDFVEYIRSEAKNRGLTNLFGALVQANGLDEFYLKHRYDLVFLSNVYHCIENRIDYFSRLRELLKTGARLVLVMYNQVPMFAADDLDKVDELAKALSDEPEDGPFWKYLSEGTRHLLKEPSDREALKGALAADLNRMLSDPKFYRIFYRDSYFNKDFLDPAERDFANWLLMTLGEGGILDKKPEQIGANEMRALLKLNRLLIGKRFGEFLAQGGAGTYLPAGDANRHTSKYVMLRELEAAGYDRAGEVRLSAFYDALIMVPRAQ